ncbi:MAG: ral secretion pathway protein GspC, partial [Myxococcales bacterium]|nr:ral secretion pathway protein GspC [Myxococcales bacterium]
APAAPVTPPVAPAAPPTAAAPTAPATAPVAPSVSADRKPVTAVLIARAELDRELGDFGALSQNIQVAAQPDGGFRLAQVRAGSFFERIGLRTNDVVVRVDGRSINGVDDASAAYAWLRVTNRFSVEVVRDGRPMTLRYVVAPAQPMTAAAR